MKRTVPVSDELYQRAAKAAETECVSVEDFVSSALSDQLAARQYLRKRAARADRGRFLAALDRIPDAEPAEHDKL
jgi:hypothetical protein